MWNNSSEQRLSRMTKKKAAAKKILARAASKSTTWATETRAKLIGKSNKAEERIEKLLINSGTLFVREHAMKFRGKNMFIDFTIETVNGIVAIEVDGSQHMTPRGQVADRAREKHIFQSNEAVAIVRMSWAVAMRITRDELIEAAQMAARQYHACVLLY